MKIALALLIVVGCLCLAQCKRQEKKQEPKSSFTSVLETAPGFPVLTLGDGNFSKFVVERPREYHAVLLFTATAPKYQCSVCVATKRAFSDAAAYYREQYDLNTTSPQNRVVYFLLEVDSARNTFNDMGLETVPRIYALPPTKSDSPKMRMGEYEIEVRAIMEGAKAFLADVESRTGVKVSVTVSPVPVFTGLCIVAYFLALLAASAATDPEKAIFWYQTPWLWSLETMKRFCWQPVHR